MTTDNPDYIGLRHLSPETVRTLRAALDNGITVEGLRKIIKKHDGNMELMTMTLNALDYMAANPQAGQVQWTEGEGYVFVEAAK